MKTAVFLQLVIIGFLAFFLSGCAAKAYVPAATDPIQNIIDRTEPVKQNSAELSAPSEEKKEQETPAATELLFEDGPAYPYSPILEEIIKEEVSVLGYRLKVLVNSARVEFFEITNLGEMPIGTFPAWTAQKKFDHEIPYGIEIPITHAVINPSWRPTDKMIADQKKDLESGKKIPPGKIYRPYRPGERGNPLGRLAFYLDRNYWNIPLRVHDSPSIPKQAKTGKDGKPRGERASRGCARVNLVNLLTVAEETTEKSREELEKLVKSKEPHRLKFELPVTVIFIRG
ncbi:MAG: hypothetical protein UW87_C0028G0008 [Candidatus Moranbacteria bacterium GW2011_GWC2_45_10]|nr:MAG: hypothetical protein UW87_C0028G0008 [Candidatus Moranbacteria bacterium GW2011_GWC2_45_10]